MRHLQEIARRLLQWWDNGHAELPWRRDRDPYRVWVAEIMLQQTQVATVIPYYERWMARFPTVESLAAASPDQVLKLWEGLGYYSRARNLRAAAQTVVSEYGGRVPGTASELQQLKGIGRYTAGAIASIAFGQAVPAVDGNVIRILSRLFDVAEDMTAAATKRRLWQLATDLVPADRPGAFNQALMELGQTVCLPSSPRCDSCPLDDLCLARKRGTQSERPVRPSGRQKPHYHVAAGIIWGADHRFLITRRPYDGMLGGLWEFPGGKQEGGETLPQALRREIGEELGIDIEVGSPIASIKHGYTHFRITLHAFHARHVSGQPQNLGVADHQWVRLPDLDRFAFAVTDLKIIRCLKAESDPPVDIA